MSKLHVSIDKNIVDVSRQKSASERAVRDVRARMNAVGKINYAYELELLREFARNQVNAIFVIPVLVSIVAAISFVWIQSISVMLWAAFAIMAHLVLSLLSKKFIKDKNAGTFIRIWRRNFVFAQILIAACWTFYTTTNCTGCAGTEYQIIQFSTIVVFVGVTTMFNHALGHWSLVSVVPPTFFMVGKLAFTMQTPLLVMAGILLILLMFSQVLARRFQSMLISMYEQGAEKERLIADLETEKSISEGARKRAEDANLAKSRFLATMSHELRTPLNAILGFSEVMREEMFGYLGNDIYREYATNIHSSGSHLLKLINEILDISRIEAGKHELCEEELNLVSVVDEARRMMEIKARQKNIHLTTSFEHNLPLIRVDERAIRQVTLNMLSNALKFTPPGGKISVKAGRTSQGGQYFSIKDTGPGISENEIPIVLSSFGQGTIAIKHAEPGTGLGLTIVQALLQLHQGRFDIKSKLRAGTEAIAYLPASRVCRRDVITPPLDDDADYEPVMAMQA